MLDYPVYYVIDTNILIDFPNVIPNGEKIEPESPTIDFSNAVIVIPTTVVRELSYHKTEMSDRGLACRKVLKRIRKIVENSGYSLTDVYNLHNLIEIKDGTQKFCILPVHKDFTKLVPFKPSDEDMDGQIILAALSIALHIHGVHLDENSKLDLTTLPVIIEKEGLHVPESYRGDPEKIIKKIFYSVPENIVLVTNDNGLAIRAAARGLRTSRFSYKVPPTYTGRRDIVVPYRIFEDFVTDGELDLETWEHAMPKEPPLVANEFIIMEPQNNKFPPNYDPDDRCFLNIGRYDALTERIVKLRYIRNFPISIKNAGQAIYAEALMNPDYAIVLCTGPAGTGKTYMASVYCYLACQSGQYISTTVVPCQIENDGVGYLPGDLDEKLDPNVQPIKNALRNYLIAEDKDIRKLINNYKKFGDTDDKKSDKSIKARLSDNVNLIWDNWFGDPVPIAYARGRDFSHEIAFFDEFQDQNRTQADTLLKRLGADSKIIITGDIEQIHAAYLDKENNGLTYARNLVKDNPMVAQVTFTEDEVIRHPLVRMIVQRQKSTPNP